LEAGDGSLVVHQLIPRTHERSRVVSHVLANGKGKGALLAEAVGAALGADKAACEAPQTAASAGGEAAAAQPGSALARFRARVAAAHATATSG
jgi:hypothetical protein